VRWLDGVVLCCPLCCIISPSPQTRPPH
jgi:hypothetical protein